MEAHSSLSVVINILQEVYPELPNDFLEQVVIREEEPKPSISGAALNFDLNFSLGYNSEPYVESNDFGTQNLSHNSSPNAKERAGVSDPDSSVEKSFSQRIKRRVAKLKSVTDNGENKEIEDTIRNSSLKVGEVVSPLVCAPVKSLFHTTSITGIENLQKSPTLRQKENKVKTKNKCQLLFSQADIFSDENTSSSRESDNESNEDLFSLSSSHSEPNESGSDVSNAEDTSPSTGRRQHLYFPLVKAVAKTDRIPRHNAYLHDYNYVPKASNAKNANCGRLFSRSEPCSKSNDAEFLKSLSENVGEFRCHPEAMKFHRQFKRNRESLVTKLYKIFNETVFENKLPENMEIFWNAHLRVTAGLCQYRYLKRNSLSQSFVEKEASTTSTAAPLRSAIIELSDKVCDSAERVRDTLLHEMCHAAVFIINGLSKECHGRQWKYWMKMALYYYPFLPLISRCHDYDIKSKYTYKCSNCGDQINRHSKSLDTERKRCGMCKGKFILLVNRKDGTQVPVCQTQENSDAVAHTPHKLNAFALFVKENYSSVKSSGKIGKKTGSPVKHKDVMVSLSKQFSELKSQM